MASSQTKNIILKQGFFKPYFKMIITKDKDILF